MESASPEEDRVPPPDQNFFACIYNSIGPGATKVIPRLDTAPHGVETRLHRLITDRRSLMDPARSESCPSRQRRGPAAPGEDKLTSPDHKSFHTFATPTPWRRKQ